MLLAISTKILGTEVQADPLPWLQYLVSEEIAF
jgi:hypothetical protein